MTRRWPPFRGKGSSSATSWIIGAILVAGTLIAFAVAVDDLKLSEYQLRVWDLVAKTVAGAAVLGGGFRYLHERRSELGWEKTRFMIELFEDFDASDRYQRSRRLVDEASDSQDDSYLQAIVGPLRDLSEQERCDRECLDRYFDFFDRLYTYVFITRTLSPDDVASFWGYAIDIAKRPPLRRFALEWGYEDVLRLAECFEDAAEKRNQLIEQLEEKPPLNPGVTDSG